MTCQHLLFLFLLLTFTHHLVNAGKSKVHITDDLDDVIDDEEDEEWKSWGKKKSKSADSDFNPPDLDKMGMSEIQDEMLRTNTGPAFGFVKLQLGVKRSKDMVAETAMKWTKVARTGAIEAKFMGVDLGTIMFTMERGQDIIELKEFVLDQPEAYEIKIGDQVFRRPGDPPLEEIIEKFQAEKIKADDANPTKSGELQKDEL